MFRRAPRRDGVIDPAAQRVVSEGFTELATEQPKPLSAPRAAAHFAA